MAQRAGRVGVNPADVNPVTGHINVQVPGNVYTKTQVDNKFLTKTKAASDYQTKNLSVPIELLDGSALTVEDALQGINSEVNDIDSIVDTAVIDISNISNRVDNTPYSYEIRHSAGTTKTYLLSFERDYPILFFATTYQAQACTVTTKSSSSALEPFVVPLNFTGTNEIFSNAEQVSFRSFKITVSGYRNVFILSDTKCTITEVVNP